MISLKNNPHDLLAKEKVDVSSLSERAKEGIQLFDETFEDFKNLPSDKHLLQMAEEIGKEVCEVVKEEVEELRAQARESMQVEEKKQIHQAKSKDTVQKAEKTLDTLSICREKLREDRKRKMASGEIQAPKKKTLTTKLRTDLLHFAVLIPKKLRDDPDVIERTQKAILRFLSELKSIWGLDKIKPITDEIREKFRKLEEAAVKPKDFRQN